MDFLSQAPPCDIRAERVIAGLLIRPELIPHVVRRVESRDFLEGRNGLIFASVIRLWDENSPIDVVTIRDALRRSDDLGKVGGESSLIGYLAEIGDEVPDPSNSERYAEIVHDRALIRDAGRAYHAAALASLEAASTAEFLAESQSRFDAIRAREYRDEPSAAEMVDQVLAGIGEHSASRMPTGFRDLDTAMAGGVEPSESIVLAAQTGVGKSTLALNIAANFARAGSGAAFFSVEMRTSELFRRLLFSEARVDPIRAARAGGFLDSETERMKHVADLIKGWPLQVEYRARLTPMTIRARAQQLRAEWGGNLGLVVADYVGLISSDRREERREREVASISRAMKLIAGEIDCAVISVAQLNRGVDRREDQVPRLSDLRDSGAVEQDADGVWFLYVDPRQSERTSVEMIIAKNRRGPQTRFALRHFPEQTRFEDTNG
jgi:replicative DNA helicase